MIGTISKSFVSVQRSKAVAPKLLRQLSNHHVATSFVAIEEVDSIDGSDQVALANGIRNFYASQTPVILRGVASHFPAVDKWKNMNYLIENIGSETLCDVEIGPYNQGERVTVPFESYSMYLNKWMEMIEAKENIEKDQLIYLAQNDLPTNLLTDIEIPTFCSDDKLLVGNGKLYSVMYWMGPSGCLSPIHFDPLDNLLIQVIGRKKVILINKEVEASLLYCAEGSNPQQNTSAIEDIENPDYSKYPRFLEVDEIKTGELHPGDLLFIPRKWWHAARSLDFSISVNTWWR